MFQGPGPNGRSVFQLPRSTHLYTKIYLLISSNTDNTNNCLDLKKKDDDVDGEKYTFSVGILFAIFSISCFNFLFLWHHLDISCQRTWFKAKQSSKTCRKNTVSGKRFVIVLHKFKEKNHRFEVLTKI